MTSFDKLGSPAARRKIVENNATGVYLAKYVFMYVSICSSVENQAIILINQSGATMNYGRQLRQCKYCLI